MNTLFEIGIVVLGLLVTGAIVAFIHYFSSGWFKLRKIYSTRRPILKEEWSFQWAEICSPYNFDGLFGRFTSCLIFGYSDYGFFAAGMFPLGLVFRPVLVPWDEVILTTVEGKGVGFTTVPEVTILVSSRVYNGLLDSGMVKYSDGLIAPI